MNQLPAFTKLKKLSKKDMSDRPQIRLALLGDCATQHLAVSLKGYAAFIEQNLQVYDADYNQIEAQLVDPGSELYRFMGEESGFILLCMCTQMLYHRFVSCRNKAGFAQEEVQKIRSFWEIGQSRTKAVLLQLTFPVMDDGVYGNYAAKTEESFLFQVRKLNVMLSEQAALHKQVFLIDADRLQSRYGADAFCDEKMYYIAKMPWSAWILPELAKQVLDVVMAVRGSFKKCLITDLDNTLWGGVVGDDGIEGIEIGELGIGHAFEELQLWMKELKKRGILLAVCSKNDEDRAKEPFEKHPDMILRLDDFAMFAANWEDKAANILHIQQTLNIGQDSLVFLDDNPFEREQVRSMLPMVTVPELPPDPALYLTFLRDLNLFETASVSAEDADRTGQYQAEAKRVQSMASFADYDEYLESLGMEAQVRPFDEFHIPRIAQLTQRSNQFNLRTVRCTEEDVRRLAESDRYITMYMTLKDKFGDHGLISVVILEKVDTDTLFMYNWLMSCRVLKRGMEEFILNAVMKEAADRGYRTVLGEYIRTPKNRMVQDIYERLGFTRIDETHFSADVKTWKMNKTHIKPV